MMKHLVCCFAIVLGLFVASTSAAECDKAGITNVENCVKGIFYLLQQDIGTIKPEDVYKGFNETKQTIDGVNAICGFATILKACFTDPVKKNCLNQASILKTSFVNHDAYTAQLYLTMMIEADYSCNTGYQVLNQSFDCLTEAAESCYDGHAGSTQNCRDDYTTCVTTAATKNCGAPAGCYAKKDALINTCYEKEPNCPKCLTLDYAKKPFMDACVDDVIPPPPLPTPSTSPPTTTPPTTTTTTTPIPTTSGGNGLQIWTTTTAFVLIGMMNVVKVL